VAVACTVFEVAEEVSPGESARRLRSYRVSLGDLEFLDMRVELGVAIRDVVETPEGVSGVFEEVLPVSIEVDTVSARIPVRVRNSFRLAWVRGACYALVFAKRRRALRVADSLSHALFGEGGRLQAMYIPPEKLRRLCSREGVKVRQVVLKSYGEGLKTAVLYGVDLQLQELRKRFAESREVYVVYEDDVGVFGVGSAGYVVTFSMLTEKELEEYIADKIIPLLEPPAPSQ